MARTKLTKQRREARDARYRAVIVEIAEETFADHGFEGARMQDIAAAAQVSLATLYGLFDSKQALYAAIHILRGQQLLVAALPAALSDDGPLERLLAGHRAYVRFLIDHPSYLKMHLRERSAWFEHTTFRSDEQVSVWKQGITALTFVVRQGIEAGALIDDDPEVLARTMVAMDQVRLADYVARGMADDPDALIERQQALLRRVFGRA